MKITEDLLKKYAKGSCTEAECKAVEKWLASEEVIEDYLYKSLFLPEQEATLKQLQNRLWGQESLSLQSPERNQEKEGIESVEKYVSSKTPHLKTEFEGAASNGKHQRTAFVRNRMRYVAVAVILIMVGFFSYRTLSDNFGADGTEQSITLKTINTQRGEKRTITLSDGSTIRMNYETEIRVPEQFGGDKRVVYLTGHAHFDVARDTERPFIIYTEDSKTQVLGTSFDINTREEGETEIIVTSGKVAFSEKSQADNLVTLALNDRAILDSNKRITTDKVEAFALIAWKDNILYFEDRPFKEIIEVIEPWFDVTIKVRDSTLNEKLFTFSNQDLSFEEFMSLASQIAKFEYRVDGKEVVIY
ncbi:MAG: FecR domain-containing protein [Bacteroidota bacterium]